MPVSFLRYFIRLQSRDKEAMRPQGCKGHLSPPGLRAGPATMAKGLQELALAGPCSCCPSLCPLQPRLSHVVPALSLCPCRLSSSLGCPTWLAPSFADSSASCLPLPGHTKPWAAPGSFWGMCGTPALPWEGNSFLLVSDQVHLRSSLHLFFISKAVF